MTSADIDVRMVLGRKISALVLSAIILPIILLPSFHHHERPVEGPCGECSRHIPHNHFSQYTDSCQVCQLFATSFAPSHESALPAPPSGQADVNTAYTSGPENAEVTVLSTRAPPVFFC